MIPLYAAPSLDEPEEVIEKPLKRPIEPPKERRGGMASRRLGSLVFSMFKPPSGSAPIVAESRRRPGRNLADGIDQVSDPEVMVCIQQAEPHTESDQQGVSRVGGTGTKPSAG